MLGQFANRPWSLGQARKDVASGRVGEGLEKMVKGGIKLSHIPK